MSKLNSVVALATLIGKSPEQVQVAEEKGELENVIAEFNNNSKVFSLTEISDLKQNTEKLFIDNLIKGNDIPQDLYNKVKGTVLEQTERRIKRNYEFDGEYNNFDELLDNIITTSAKQPNESKKEDIEKIKELETRLTDYAKTAQLNQDLKTQILNHEQILLQKTSEIENKYQTRILNEKLNEKIKQIPFADSDNEATRKALINGFEYNLRNSIDFKFSDEGKIVAYDKETQSLITDKVGGALDLSKVIENQVKASGLALKAVKQGDDIQSTTYSNGFKTREDVQKYIADKNIVGLQEQAELYAKLPV
jgi:hypothetical protein